MSADAFGREIAVGECFEFGKSWQRFLEVVDVERIVKVEQSLQSMLGPQS